MYLATRARAALLSSYSSISARVFFVWKEEDAVDDTKVPEKRDVEISSQCFSDEAFNMSAPAAEEEFSSSVCEWHCC